MKCKTTISTHELNSQSKNLNVTNSVTFFALTPGPSNTGTHNHRLAFEGSV